MVEDITERKQAEKKLKYLSLHDQLTGLYNRAYFEEEINKLEDSGEYPITIVCIDMDGLKLINDTMGQ
jgi:diguanylate cyclase (GGDEF)-like protein